MKITNEIEIIDLSLKIGNNLVFSDFHIGYEEALNKEGVMVPRHQFKETMKRLEQIFSKVNNNLSRIIITGDIKHEFGKVSESEWRHTLKLLDFLSKKCDELILVKGNHDTILEPIAEKRNVKIVDYFILNDKILIIHGDKVPEKKIISKVEKIIIGHEHPAISIKDGVRTETFKCFLKGKYSGKDLIVMPSFNLVTEGNDLRENERLSPFLQQDLNDFSVFLVADKVYSFGKLGEI